jgi:hypothetical protein
MPGTGQYSTIINNLVLSLTNLNFSIDGIPVAVQLRKIKEALDGFAGQPVIVVCTEDPESRERLFSDCWRVNYATTVFLVNAGRADVTGILMSDLGVVLDWRELVANCFKNPPLSGMSSIMHIEIDYNPPIDQSLVSKGMDLSALRIVFSNMEGSN